MKNTNISLILQRPPVTKGFAIEVDYSVHK